MRRTSTDAHGIHWSAKARFRPTDDGTLNLDHAKALGGSYKAVNGMGLIETLEPKPVRSARYWWSKTQALHQGIDAEGGTTLAGGDLPAAGGPGSSVFHGGARRFNWSRCTIPDSSTAPSSAFHPVSSRDGSLAGHHPNANQVAVAKEWPRLVQFLHTTSR